MTTKETPGNIIYMGASVFAAGMLGGILHKFETQPVRDGGAYTNTFYITIDGQKYMVTVDEVPHIQSS